jgi:hypothetical protein
MVDVTRLSTVTTAFDGILDTKVDPFTGTHTIDTGTTGILVIYNATLGLGAFQSNNVVLSASINSENFTEIYQEATAVLSSGARVLTYVGALINPAATGSQNWSIDIDTAELSSWATQEVVFLNFSGVQNITTAADMADVIDTALFGNSSPSTADLLATGVSAGDFQVIHTCSSGAETQASTINNGWAELADIQTGADISDAQFAVYDTSSFTDDDATQTITFSPVDSIDTLAIRLRINNRQFYATGITSIPVITQSTTIKRPPRVYLNTTQTKAGATELAVQSYNDAGTSLTFNDPQGTGPTGSAFLGIENTSTHFIDWQAVTVNTGPIGSGTPSITPIEAAGNALRTTVTVTDVANSGETPGAGSETWNDGSSGNVITGTGFV